MAKLTYLSGHIRESLPPYIGFMLQPNMGNRPDLTSRIWAADNGCFAAGDGFRLQFFETMLESLDNYRGTCLFAVAPDVLGNAEATIKRSMPVLPRLRGYGYRAAFVAQDGQENLPVPWDEFDCLFVGGSTKWKLSEPAYSLVAEAKTRGKWAHMGRVNSEQRLRAAAAGGYDSCDGTFLKFGPDKNAPRLVKWLDRLGQNLGLLALHGS